MPNPRATALRKIIDDAMGQYEQGKYIIKYDKAIEKMLIKLHKENKELFSQIMKRLKEYSRPEFWKADGRAVSNNPHRSAVGEIKYQNEQHIINKIDVNQGTRMFLIRYFDTNTERGFVMLVGVLVASQREDTNEWSHEVRRICQRFGGTAYDVEQYGDVLDLLNNGYEILDYHAGYIARLDTEDSQKLIQHGLTHVDTNITITYDQIDSIEKRTPLVVDGHAGTGKSVIIALRIALETITAFKDGKNKNFLVLAYNQRVLNMVKKYAEEWMKALEPSLPDHYLSFVEYKTTIGLYRDLTKEHDRDGIPDPTEVRSVAKLVNFYRFEHKFFSRAHAPISTVSPEQAWHFIRGILKGNKFGWPNDERLTLNDFNSVVQGEAKIPKAYTQLMDADLIGELLNVFHDYEDWRKRENALDDIDIVRLATIALDNYGKNKPKIESSFAGSEYFKNFDLIFIDEAQDLTMVEFELIYNLLIEAKRPNLVIGGDPLQTINPTGFTWEAIRVFMYKLLKEKIDFERMLVSHRLTKELVNFANVVIKKRHHFDKKDLELMKASNEHEINHSNILRVPVNIDDDKTQDMLRQFLEDSLGSNYGILIWARDKSERDELIAQDPVLQRLVGGALGGDSNIEDKVILHSVESVKGLEYENVIFYRFGDLGKDFTKLMEKAATPDADDSENYTILYHLNRLFIAATRSKSNIYIFDGAENLEKCWNEDWWEGTTSVEMNFETFSSSVDTEPSLDLARDYYIDAKDNNNLQRANEAYMMVKRCKDSDERNGLMVQIDILRTTLDLALNEQTQEEHLRKKKHLIELYQQSGQPQEVILMRLDLKQWDEVYQEITTQGNRLPQTPKMDFYQCLSGLHIPNEGIGYLETILTKRVQEYRAHGSDEKESFRARIREHVQKYIRSLKSQAIKSLVGSWNYNEIDIINWLQPEYIKGKPDVCSKEKDDFLKKLKDAFGTPLKSTLPTKAYLRHIELQLENPHLLNTESERLTDLAADAGDYEAGKRKLRRQLRAAESWSFASRRSVIYNQILVAINENAFVEDLEFVNEFNLLKPRLQYWKEYHAIRSSLPKDWLNTLKRVDSLLSQDLAKTITSELPIFQRLGSDGGKIWEQFETNFLTIPESVRTELQGELLFRLYKQRSTLQGFNREPSQLTQLLAYDIHRAPELWVEGFRVLSDTIVGERDDYNPECAYLYCKVLTNDKSKKLTRQLLRQFARNFISILSVGNFRPTLRKNIQSLQPWLVGEIAREDKNHEISPVIVMYQKAAAYIENKDSLSKEEFDNLLTLAESQDPELYIELTTASGRKASAIPASVYIKNFKKEKFKFDEILHCIQHEEIDYQFGELPWLAGGIDVRPVAKGASVELSDFDALMLGAVQGFNLNATMLTLGIDHEIDISHPKMMSLGLELSRRAERQCELWAADDVFWERAGARDQLVDWYKPRRDCDPVLFEVIAVLELLLILRDMTQKERVDYLKKSWLPEMKGTTKKQDTIDQLFETNLFKRVFSNASHQESMELAKQMLGK